VTVPSRPVSPSRPSGPRAWSRLSVPGLALAAMLLGGCASTQSLIPSLSSFAVYKIDINQGNYLSQDMVDRLKVGMTRQQVKQTLGTPLVTSAFRDNRWDYVYEYAHQGKVRERRQFTVYFTEDKLARWEGDEMPQSVVELNRSAGDKGLRGMPKDDDRSLMERIKAIFSRD
jgi:outer membrane protein assembly factor BamE